jgi:hypothetical protein
MGDEHERWHPPLAQQESAGEMDRVQSPDGGGHREPRTLEDWPGHGNGPDASLHLCQAVVSVGEAVIVERALQP